jgi:hypothetical protein
MSCTAVASLVDVGNENSLLQQSGKPGVPVLWLKSLSARYSSLETCSSRPACTFWIPGSA